MLPTKMGPQQVVPDVADLVALQGCQYAFAGLAVGCHPDKIIGPHALQSDAVKMQGAVDELRQKGGNACRTCGLDPMRHPFLDQDALEIGFKVLQGRVQVQRPDLL